MIENIDRLSSSDKLFMIHNPKSFSLPTISTINFNREKWMEEIELKLHPDVINKVIIDHNIICDISSISYVTRGKVSSDIEDVVTKKIIEISDMACETKENINDIFSMFGYVLKVIDENFIQTPNQYKKDVVEYFLCRLFMHKLQAHEIYEKTITDIAPGDNLLREYCSHTLRWLIKEILSSNLSYDKASVILYQICKYLTLDEKSSNLKILVNLACIIHPYLEFEDLMNSTVTLLKERIDALTAINKISVDEVSEMSKLIISNAKRTIENNYEKNKVSSKLNNGGLCVGDNVFDDGVIIASKLLMELDMLSAENLKDYIGENKITSFGIPENDIGYLRLREKLPICKVLTKESGFYTLTRYENTSYLLFKIVGDSKCYGISFPSEFGGGRKVVVFDIPTNYEYVMTM